MKKFSDLPLVVQEPEYVGNIICANEKLTSLKGAPEKVNGSFFCYGNKLSSLEFCPKEIKRMFDCSGNPLRTIKHLKDTKGIDKLFLSETKYMKADDYLKEVFDYNIKFKEITIVNKNTIIISKPYKELKKDYLTKKYDIENF